jgi:tetratricopeptide (TPR) repeat protein
MARMQEAMVAESPEAMVRTAMALQREERFPEALDAYLRLLDRWPRLPDCWFNLAVVYRRLRFLPQALQAYENALATGVARPEEAHLNRAVIYADMLGQHEAAERELEAALKLNPVFIPALLNRANLYEDLGRREAAQAAYERVLTLEPAAFEALARLANLGRPGVADLPMVERLRIALASRWPSAAERASLGFALGRQLDNAGDYPAAFVAYTAANAASLAAAPPGAQSYDRRWQEALVDSLIATDPPLPDLPPPPPAGPRPIFVCGMFRSGSTLAEQLLATVPGVAAGGEIDFLPRVVGAQLRPFPASLATVGPSTLAGIRDGYLAELKRIAPGAQWVIDKRPDNFLYLSLIRRLFPDARIVHTVRAPLDNCLSVYFLHLDHSMRYAFDLMDIGHYYREYRRLMSHWRSRFAAQIHDFDYDALVADPKPALQSLCGFLGLEWGERMPESVAVGRAVKTASVWQVREPLYRQSSGRAAHYVAELRGLASFLAQAGIE